MRKSLLVDSAKVPLVPFIAGKEIGGTTSASPKT